MPSRQSAVNVQLFASVVQITAHYDLFCATAQDLAWRERGGKMDRE